MQACRRGQGAVLFAPSHPSSRIGNLAYGQSRRETATYVLALLLRLMRRLLASLRSITDWLKAWRSPAMRHSLRSRPTMIMDPSEPKVDPPRTTLESLRPSDRPEQPPAFTNPE